MEIGNESTRCPSRHCAHWVARIHTGRLTQHDQSALTTWLSLSHTNRRAYLKTEVIWRLAGGLTADPKIRKEVRRLRRRL